jgi:hypothetical protein
MQLTSKNTDTAKLESALPSMIAKLRELQTKLSPEERVVFGEIIESAALHTQLVQAHDEGNHDILLYGKPQSTHATTGMKAQYLQLPKYLGIEQTDK